MKDKKDEKFSNSETTGKNLKPFDLEAAKAGKPVCTRDGRKARIICFDVKDKNNMQIIALVQSKSGETEVVNFYYKDGKKSKIGITGNDLMMVSEKHEGWINIVKNADDYYYCNGVFSSEEHARNNEANYPGLVVSTVKIEWEE